MRTRVKICCIASPGEAKAAVVAGADAVGIVGEMPSGPGPVDDATARVVARAVPPGVTPVLLTARTAGDEIAAHALFVGAAAVQVVNHVDPAEHAAMHRAAPKLKLIQVVHVEDEAALDLALGYAETADALLLDSGRPSAATPELGGTGRVHDWAVSARIVQAVPVPVWLAGGVAEHNAAEAIERMRPFGLDLCTGVRTGGRLDARKLSALFAAVRNASA